MKVKCIRSKGIAHNSYIIESGGEAAVIDPRRDFGVYLDHLIINELKLKYIFETHRNEDYVIGSQSLSKLTGAGIYHGSKLNFEYGNGVSDNDEFYVGDFKINALETPGHTDESVSYKVSIPSLSDEVIMAFTGDLIFAGDTGRIDLYGDQHKYRLSSMMYDSIFNKILPLGDSVIMYPAHGAGSVCGGNINSMEHTTLGFEKRNNPSLQASTKNEFIQMKIEEKHRYAPYFKQMEIYNLCGFHGYEHPPSPPPLSPAEIKKSFMNGSCVLIDTRAPADFSTAHIKGSYNIWLDGLPSFGGWIISHNDNVIIVTYDGYHCLNKAVKYLFRLGYDKIEGYLKGGIESWYLDDLPVESISVLTVDDLKNKIESNEDLEILDVRDDNEWELGHIRGARHIYVGDLESTELDLPHNKTIVVYCSTGKRSSLAASILKRKKYQNVYNLMGGITVWYKAGYELI